MVSYLVLLPCHRYMTAVLVATGPKGNYLDSSGIKPPRLKWLYSTQHTFVAMDWHCCYSRHGQLEDRDPHRLRDRNGGPILCFQCGLSALPSSLSASVPAAKRTRRSTSKASTPDTWKSIISCDYCNLHWHMDCIDPPLLTLPPFNKKWMCPNHAERVLVSWISINHFCHVLTFLALCHAGT